MVPTGILKLVCVIPLLYIFEYRTDRGSYKANNYLFFNMQTNKCTT